MKLIGNFKAYPLLLALAAIILFQVKIQGQNVSSYTFAAVSGTYTNITGTTIHAAAVDEACTSAIPIGFTFNYCCNNFTTVSVSSNGWLSFNSTTSSTLTNNLTSNTIGNVVAPLWDDEQVYTGGTVSYTTTGTSPNRIFTVQWSTMEWDYSASGDVISFQAKLYETSNKIEFIYNRGATAVSSGSASIGLSGPNSGDFLSLNGVGASPTASSSTETTTLSAKPANGQVYRWTPPTVCSGTPVPGNTVASANPACSGVAFTLSMSGTLSGCGITYQWQSSPNNATWTNISGATSATYLATQTVSTYYRCLVTCTNSGLSASSTSLQVTMNTPLNCYCTNTNTTNTTYYISSFSTTGGTTNITNNSSGFSANGYGNFTAMTVTQLQNGVINFSITETGGTMYFGIWVDWNNDGDFTDTGENVYINNSSYSSSVTGSFTVPLTATPGSHRMRVVGSESGTVAVCTGTAYTECEDYTLIVTALPACSGTPVGGTPSATATSGCSGYTSVVSVTGASVASGLTYQWESSPTGSAPWTAIAGATGETYTATVTTGLYYRRVTTCTSSSLSGTSSSISLTVNPYLSCYCASAATSTSDMDITNITFGTINNTSATVSLTGSQGTATGTAGMNSIWTASTVPVPSVQQGATVSFSVTIGGTAYSHRVDVYFDFNHDGDFTDAGESFAVFAYANPTLPNTTTYSITIPISATIGNTVMRVVCVESSSSSPCGTYTWGETEDYMVNITAAPACSGTPTGGTATATVTSGCINYTSVLTVTGGTVASGLTYQWESSPTGSAPWTPIAGATGPTYTATATGNLYYRRVVTCTSSAGTANSSSILLSVTAPSNDECVNAILINPDATCTGAAIVNGTIACASNSGVTAPTGTADDDVWFKFVAEATTQYITIGNTGGSDLVTQLFTGSCGALVSAAYYDADPSNQIWTGLTVGQTYYIRVYSYGSTAIAGTSAAFTLCVTNPPTCPAGLGTGVINIGSLPYSVTGQTTCGMVDDITSSNVPVIGNSSYYTGEDKVYIFTPATSGSITITLTSTGTYTGLMLYDGCPFSGTAVSYMQSSTGNKSYCTSVIAGHTYYLVIDSYDSPDCNPFDLSISSVSAGLVNDDPCGAISLTVGTTCSYTTYNNNCATASAGVPAPGCGSYNGGDVWFQVTVPASGHLVFDTQAGTITDADIAIYSGTCSALTLLQCDATHSSNANMGRIDRNGLTPGSTIWIRVWENGGDVNGTFGLCVYEVLPPPDIPITTSTISTCSGTFVDDGGSAGNYTNNQHRVMTICSGVAGQQIRFNFTQFMLENNMDILAVYDGNSTASFLMGQYTGAVGPQIITSSSGCLTFEFSSNSSVTNTGWSAVISCVDSATTNCISSAPFCTDMPAYSFPAGVGSGVASDITTGGTNIGCLSTTPNPAWYYMQVSTPGDINIYISSADAGGSSHDVDFALWGPFSTIAETCGSLLADCGGCSSHHPETATPADLGGYPVGNMYDCSYNAAATEWAHIRNAVAGQWYLLLITNYANIASNITFQSQSSTGATNCNVVNPVVNNNGPICYGDTLKLYCNTVAGATYAWTGPNGFTSSLQNPVIPNATTANAGDYTCIITVGGVAQTPATTTVVVNAQPTITVNSPTICSGQSTNLTASGGSTYLWSTGSTSNPITISPTANSSYTVTGTDANGCTNTAVSVVTVNSGVTATASNNSPICEGTVLNLTSTPDGGTNYSWSGPNSFSSAVQNPTITNVTAAASGTYTVTVTLTGGCTGTAQTTVTVNSLPTISCPGTYNVVACNGSIPAGANTTANFITLGGSTTGTTISYSDGTPSLVGCTETTTRTYTATLNSCTNSCTQNLTRTLDNIPPTANALPALGPYNCYTDIPAANINDVTGETDNCGGAVTVTFVSDGANPGCSGTVIRSYRLTDACGNTALINQNIIINYAGGLTPPASTTATVACPANATDPGAPASITDACGRTLTPVLVGSVSTPSPITCNGTVVWTYRYTACDGTTADWTHTYTVTMAGGLTPPANTTATVACPANATDPGAPASITDACGRSLTPVLVGSTATPDPITCNGTVVWTYRYTACDGTTADWTHTYTVTMAGGLTPPANTTATVNCPANATDPGAPATITDACGRTLTPVLVGSVSTPSPITCNGTVVWTYRYTACDGTTADWTHTYTVTMAGGLTPPANTTATVNCPANATDPGAPATITDACGRTLTPVLVGSVSTPSPITCNGTVVWTYRYTACDGITADWTHTYTVTMSGGLTPPANTTATVNCPANATDPGVPATITDACGRTLTPVLVGSVSTPSPITCNGTVVWTYRYTACDGTTADWTHTYTVTMAGGLTPPANTTATVACPANATDPGAPATITDACGRTLTPVLIGSVSTPSPITCNGTVVWTYRYTACDGTTADWTHTYTVTMAGGLTPPANTTATVNCPANATDPGAPASITDACGRSLTPVLVGSTATPDPITCNGTVVWTYRYTACDGTTADWTHTYTVTMAGGLTPPANTTATVACPANATDPGAPATITDACGRTLTPVLIGSVSTPSPITCNGTVVWTYRYTACDGTTADWTHTYTVTMAGGLTPPANTTATVNCPANATDPGAPASITDACGRSLTPVLVGSTATPDPITCNGTVVWTYRYTACDGTTADWTHTYTVTMAGGLTPPANTTATVACPANATDPGAPATITDACGRTLTPVLIGSVSTPSPITCNGTVVWTYRYTACDGTTADWTHTYTVTMAGGLTPPANTTATVACPANATDPGAPATITDACGRTLTPVLIGSVSTPSPITCNGTVVWTYRYTACDGTTADWTHTYTVTMAGGLTPPANTTATVSCPANATDPGAPASITDACGRSLTPVLVGSTATPDPITCNGTVVWTYRYTACDGTTADWTHTYTVTMAGGLTPPANTTATVACPANATDPGAPATITDACGRTLTPVLIGSVSTPSPITCNGTVVWTYRYTACDGTTADWTHTYTVTMAGGLTPPANTTATVNCPANATDPGAPASITDACGRSLTPVLVGSTATPDPITCNGTVVWTYRYTACDGTTADWTHTYTVTMAGGLTPPANTTATVNCPANATDPGVPATITDACGRTLTPVLVGSVSTPSPITCNGTVVWTYRYTACDGTTADWTHTYTVTMAGGLTPPANTTATVNCPANATDPGVPATITDACGRTLTPILVGSVSTPSPITCNGTVVWTYRYTACDGTTADWTHTYTVTMAGGLTPPANTTATVNCPANATDPGAPASITDACGRSLTPVLVGSTATPDPITCNGTVVWTYRYTACDGTTADWTHTYTVTMAGGLTPPANTTATVACPANATDPGAPATITDACGRTLTPVLIGSVSTPSPITCNGTVVWTYRYTACDGTTADWTHTYTVTMAGGLTPPANTTATVNCPANATDPGAPASITDACGRSLTPVLVGSTATPDPITCNGTVVWTYRYTACDGTTADWTHTYTVTMAGGLTPPANTTATVACPANATDPGAPATITDACGRTLTPVLIGSVSTPSPITCNGTVVWTYRYTACDGTTADWTHTYTVTMAGGLTPPANTTATVSCPANATDPGAPASITDACGRTLIPVLVGSTATPDPITCNGTVVWTYRYTACDGTTADWTHTYTVTMAGGLTPPANTTATVACPANATDPGVPATITDACGRTLTPILVGSVSTPSPITCNGTVVWTYRYTACDGTTADWTHTYTVTMSGGLTPPANTTATVDCPANATDPGAPATITDACGRTLTPVLVGSVSTPSPITCNGTVVWTYRYTACDGTTADWTHTYTVTMAGGLTPPANTTATVACPANATDPGAPATITDACGRTLTPVLVGSVSTPSPITCNGTVVWTYRYTACDGTTADWTHTYTVTMSGGLTPPANMTATVNCPANATDPGAPATITDACGRTLTPVLVGSVSTPSPITCNGTVVWTYRYTACDGTTADWTHTYTVTMAGGLTPPANTTATVSCPANATDPGAPASITDACGRTLIPVLVGSTATPDPITCNGTVVWTYRYTACDGTTADWTHTYTVTMAGGLTPPANTTATVACPANATDPGAPATITDACGRTLTPVLVGSVSTPSPITCNGTVVWTYRYTACDGTTADWTHTYTVTMAGGLTPPANTTATVSCPANATDPGAPASITDACGRSLTPVLVGSTATPDPITCNGTVVWTYRYTACDGTTADWTHTYTVTMAGGLTPPANTTATVSCPANATDPGAPASITDACGRSLTPVLVGSTATPDPITCNGTVVWTYRYTACDGTTADWTHTYTVTMAGGLTPPANTTATVACPANATDPGAPATITDACGRTLTPVLIGSVSTPSPITCNGTVVWTYRYTACDGTTADWTHTYTVTMAGGLTPPANTTATVNCPANATDPGAPASITDACGRSLTPVLVGSTATPDPITCNGTVVWTYRYTACDGTTADWTHTYTVTMAGGLTPPANTTATVNCPANATDPGVPATITDACGRTLTPVLVGSVSTPSPITCNGTVVWTYRYTACDGTTADWTHTYTVTMAGGLTPPANTTATVNCPANATDPGVPATITDACGRTLTPILVGSVSTPSPITCNGTVVWTYRYTACDGTTADWTHTYTVTMSGGLTPPANMTATVNCPANATDPGAPASITDACGRSLTPVLVGSTATPDPITCNGTVVWTYRYTACDGTTADWTHTYTVTMAGGLTPPANTTATVNCPANATDPGAPATITDACGRTLTPVLVGSVSTPSPITCNGTVVWTYRYTACDGTTADWTHTYTVTMAGGLTPPANTTATVNCPANATDPGAPATITDACGRTLTPVLVGSVSTPSPITCNGTVVWTYRYTACDGITADWTHTYTVTMSGGLTPPANTTATVNCPANATDPGVPATITDACGRTLTPVLVGSVSTPSPITCNGTVVWTYRYTACDGTTADWTHTYTVTMAGGLTPPANTTATVACPANATDPGAPATITDACGRTLTPVLIGSVSTPSPITCNGTVVWTYRYTACDGTTADWTHTYTVTMAGGLTPPANTTATVNCPANATDPGAPASITDACGRSLTPVLVGSTATPDPITCNGTVVWTYRYTACDGTTADWTHTYTVTMAGGLTPPANTTATVACPANATDPGAPATITDACGRTLTPVLVGSVSTPSPITCNGTVVWTYRYTACDGTTADWTHTYTVTMAGGLTPPANTTATVNCPANATDPGAPASITDACGRSLTPVLVGSTATPDPITCNGTVVWTYRYTACDGTTADWTHTYTVTMAGGLTPPANTTATVACPANATDPGAPATITDACGRTLTPVLIGSVSTPSPITCNGTVVWTYRYTACDGTTADWTHTYTVTMAGGLTPPANTTATVSCPANATDPGAPASITDACGRTLIPVLVGSTATPDPITCNGTVVWTYRYTACDGTTADWTHTYTVTMAGGLTPPANTTATVACPANATDPGVPATITDACGRTLTPILVGSVSTPSPITCNGTVVWTYRYTACDGTTADWTHTYTVTMSGGLTPPANTTATVDCPANATDPGAPATITDACGRTLTPVLVGSVSTPSPITCNGTVVWTYRYTACDGTTADWTHTYTVTMSGGLTPPANTTATVDCPANATDPGAPATITDACGRTLTPVLVGSVSTPSPITCNGTVVWTYRYTACDGTTADWTHTYTVTMSGGLTPPANTTATVDCPANATDPGAPATITDACGRTLTPVLVGSVSTPSPITCNGTVVWTYRYTACDGTTADWTHTYTVTMAGGLTPPANTTATVNCPSNATDPGAPATITDACGRTLTPVLVGSVSTPSPITCNGTVVWTYRYTACDGTTADWTHTYTVTMAGGLTPPANTTATVACPANATDPGAPATITDACGRTLTPVLVGSVSTPGSITCNGTVVWTYRYTACDGTTADWTHTYTVTMSGGLTPPANMTATVDCPANATDPGAPATITDACGRTLTPVLVGSVSTPSPITCNGTVVWTYRYTACDGTTADWTHTYTVSDNIAPTITICPANQTFCSIPSGNYTIPQIAATDNCIGALTYSYTITGATNRTGIGVDASGSFGIGLSTITWTVTDICGNDSANCITTVTINETPTITLVSTTCAPSLLTYDVSFTSTAGSIIITAGMLSGNIITGIPTGTNVTIEADNYGCTSTLNVTSPVCSCPTIAVATNPNNPTICFGNPTPALTVNNPGIGLQANWFSSATGGTALATNTTSFTPTNTAVGTYTYYVEIMQTASGCLSSRIPVVLKINPTSTSSTNATVCALDLPYSWNNISCSAAGNYTFHTTNYLGCDSAATLHLTVTPAIDPVFTIVNSICSGATTPSLPLVSNNGIAGTWSPSVVSNTATGTYVFSPSQCANTVQITVTVHNNPVPSISGDTLICLGQSTTLTANGGTTYVWGSNSGPSITVSPNTATIYQVVATTAQGCTGTASVMVDVSNLIMNSINSISDTCSESNGSITINVGNGIGAYTYQWSNSGSTDNTISGLSTGDYIVTVTDEAHCQLIDTINVGNFPLPILSIANSMDDHCSLGIGSATVVASGGTGNYYYQWNTNPMQNSASVTNLTTGSYVVQVNDEHCSNSIVVNVGNIPGPTAAAGYHLNQNGTANFIDLSSGATDWLWSFGGNNSSTDQNPTYHYSEKGDYTVVLLVTDSFGCVDSTSILFTINGDMDIWIPNTFTPNGDGVNDVFKPSGTGYSTEGYKMAIYNRWGQQIFFSNRFDFGWNGRIKGEEPEVNAVYTYRILIRDINGKDHIYVGRITTLGSKTF